MTFNLRSVWEGGPASWNGALSRPQVLVPFFVLAALLPIGTQYVVDNYAWTGGEYWLRIATTCAMYACLAMALNLAVGYAGLLNLGFIAYFGVGSYAYALVASAQLGKHFPLGSATLVVILAGVFFALVVALPALRLRGDYLAIVTLAFGLIMQELTLDLDRPPVLAGHQLGPDGMNITGGTEGIHLIDPFVLPSWWPGSLHGVLLQTQSYYWIALLLTALFTYLLLRWRGTRTGRAWVAIREDELAARAMGINTYGYRLLAFTVSAVMAALVGMLNAAWLHNAYPGNYDIQQTVLVYIMVILGGLGSIPGAILGAVFVAVVPFLLQPLGFYRYVVFSLVLIVPMVFRPEGLMGTVSMRPRLQLGGTLELFTSEDQAAGAASGGEAARVEAATGAIVDPASRTP